MAGSPLFLSPCGMLGSGGPLFPLLHYLGRLLGFRAEEHPLQLSDPQGLFFQSGGKELHRID
jgi:hypothetical protein